MGLTTPSYKSSLLHRAFRRITLILNRQMHYIKFHIKSLKIAPTCFDPKIFLRELRCSLLKSFLKHLQNNSIILKRFYGSISCCVRVRFRNASGYGVRRVLRSLSLRNTRRTPYPDAFLTTYSYTTR
jgi:hypothetical protein